MIGKTVKKWRKGRNKDTKYNTYKYNGLPVGPISSISTGIIKNVLNYIVFCYNK